MDGYKSFVLSEAIQHAFYRSERTNSRNKLVSGRLGCRLVGAILAG